MNQIARLILAGCVMLASGELAAATLKCVDAAGKITYSNTKCGDLGMKDAGEVKDRINVNPAYRPSPEAIRQFTPPADSKAPDAGTPAAKVEPPKPERRCFTVQTAKGAAT